MCQPAIRLEESGIAPAMQWMDGLILYIRNGNIVCAYKRTSACITTTTTAAAANSKQKPTMMNERIELYMFSLSAQVHNYQCQILFVASHYHSLLLLCRK